MTARARISREKPILAVTMGDPGGIGPEVALKAVSRNSVRRACRPVLIGDIAVLRKCAGLLRRPAPLIHARGMDALPAETSAIPVINPCASVRAHRWAAVRGDYGAAAMQYVRYAVRAARAGEADGIVTAPICKEAIHRAGYRLQGHTDFLAHLTGVKEHAMMLTGRGLRVVLVTIHVSIVRVSRLITRAAVLRTIRLARDACLRMGVRNPRVAVCGLNPHAGEAGAFGREEITAIVPAIRAAAREGIDARGPFPADTFFVARNRRGFDIVVAMYHDQGLIPLKMLAFDRGVNVTLGLPVVRTSPDHGTAFDIAGKGVADPESMTEALLLAARMCARGNR
ncbi:MAG: 4-hydroxythreonine-4-phosphate dehydrogenase PdxA [Chlamydiota bacterium]